MIRVNLATRFRKSVPPKAEGAKSRIDLSRISDLRDHLKDVPAKKVVLHGVVALMLYVTTEAYKSGEVQKLDVKLQKINAQKPALEAKLKELKIVEDEKKQIEVDEDTLRHKLDAIKKLVEGRSTVVRILADLCKLTPKAVWLTNFDLQENSVDIKGTSIDFDPINDFEKLIDENQYFKEVTTQSSQNDKRLVDFELKAKRGMDGH